MTAFWEEILALAWGTQGGGYLDENRIIVTRGPRTINSQHPCAAGPGLKTSTKWVGSAFRCNTGRPGRVEELQRLHRRIHWRSHRNNPTHFYGFA
jgi:hypothetical protein